MREFTATQTYPFEQTSAGGALRELLTSPALGPIWLVEDEMRVIFWFEFSSTYSYTAAMRTARAASRFSDAPWTRAFVRAAYGAPSIVVGDELFWGLDRLEDALR